MTALPTAATSPGRPSRVLARLRRLWHGRVPRRLHPRADRNAAAEPAQTGDTPDLRGIVDGDESVGLSPVRVRLRSREQPADMSPEDALLRYQRFVVLGAAGAGKTTMLRQLAARPASDAVVASVHLSLRGYADSGMADIVLYAVTGVDGVDSMTAERITTGEVLLLLDGLDEVLAGATDQQAWVAHRRVVDAIDRLCAGHPAARIVVTCRPGAWRGTADTWPVLEILDLTRLQAEEIVHDRLRTEPWRAGMLCAAVAADPVFGAFAANPLSLSLLAAAPEPDLAVAAGRAAPFEQIVKQLLVDRDAGRGVERFAYLTPARTCDLLAELAWHAHCRNRGTYRSSELVPVVAEFLTGTDVEPGRARAVLDQIVTGSGLLTSDDGDGYRFAYPGVQVHFAAVAATTRGATAVAHLVRHRHDPWWQDVLLLVAGRTVDASPLLLGILGRGPRTVPWPQRRLTRLDDDVERKDLLLAARCLGARPRTRARWLPAAIIEATYTVMRTDPLFRRRLSAAHTLGAIGGRHLPDRLIADLTNGSLDTLVRGSVAIALGETGDDRVAARLAAMLKTLGPYDYLDIDLAIALRKLRYSAAVPALRDRLEHRYHTGGSVSFLAGAMVALGGADEAARLWRLLQEPTEAGRGNDGSSILWALGRAADPQVEPWLLHTVRAGPDSQLSTAVDGYLTRRGPGGMPHLVTALLARSSWGTDIADIADTLHRYAALAPSGPVFDAFTDPRRNRSVRWALSALLDAHPDTWPALSDLLNRPDTGRLAAAASAAVLGRQEHPDARGPLRHALPALISQRGLAARPYALRRVAAALSALGDDAWAQDTLLSHIHALLTTSTRRAGIRPLLTALGGTRLDRISDAVADLVVRLVTDAPAGIDHWYWAGGGAPLAIPPVAPRVLHLVESGQLDRNRIWDALQLVALAAPDLSLVPRVLSLLSPTDNNADAGAFDILTAIGRRHQVRIFADGRIVPVQPSEPAARRYAFHRGSP